MDVAVHPIVAFIDNATIAGPSVSKALDALAAHGRPVVLAVGLPDLPRPETGHRPTQRRIDLLAIEQNAWTLAARDARCVVVATRTEIDWAMRQGRMIVWAPSKIVLDAVDGPKATAGDGLALAIWLAEQLAADRLVVHGRVSVPAGSRVRIEKSGI